MRDRQIIIQFLKLNGFGVFFRLQTIVSTVIVTVFILNIFSAGVSNDASMGWNLFVSVNCWGAILMIWLFALVSMKWFDYILPRKELKENGQH